MYTFLNVVLYSTFYCIHSKMSLVVSSNCVVSLPTSLVTFGVTVVDQTVLVINYTFSVVNIERLTC